MDRLGRLADANTLLYQLHQVTQTLPASLDLNEVLDATHEQLKELFDYDALALLVLDDTDQRWHVMRRAGDRPTPVINSAELPPPLARPLQPRRRSEEHPTEPTSLMPFAHPLFCFINTIIPFLQNQ